MRVRHASLALLCVVAEKFVQVSLAEHVVHERAVSTNDWAKQGNINPHGLLPVRIGLTQQNLDQGHEMLMERSTPGSPKYGQHMTQEEVVNLFAPHEDSVNAVHNWLESEGISPDRVSRSSNLQWIQFHATVTELERLTNATYDIYEHQHTGSLHVGTDEYSIPAHLVEHIDLITPAVNKLQISGRTKGRHASKNVKARDVDARQAAANFEPNMTAASPLEGPAVSTDCNIFITPRCLANMYNLPLANSSADPNSIVVGNELGIFEEQPYNQTALSWFFKKFASFVPSHTTPLFDSIDGAARFSDNRTSDTTGDGESMLDLEVAYPLVYPQRVRVLAVDDLHYQESTLSGMFNSILDAIDGSYCNRTAYNITGDSPQFDPVYPDPVGYQGQRMCGTFTPTNVISISYSPEERQQTENYDLRQCSEWMKLNLQGVTIVGASGDHGVAGNSQTCIDNPNGWNIFNPLSLTNCPYVLSVGATQLAPGDHDGSLGYEVATTSIDSGGGFSNIYAVPEWQQSAVEVYFQEKPDVYLYYNTTLGQNIGITDGVFNRGGRGIPDVSANRNAVVVVDGDSVALQYGTSASAPIVAAIITRINEELLKMGLGTVGFINPALYANPSVLNDITEGNNPGCNTPGFYAAGGWDPVTGLGTPDYIRMLDYFVRLGQRNHTVD
ncbi:Pro-kumamolisin, activation domain-containing protein [Trichoderma austrokoningii]